MRTIECPGCGHGFVMRRAGRCPRCKAVLTYEGHRFQNEVGDRVFLWIPADGRWFEVVPS